MQRCRRAKYLWSSSDWPSDNSLYDEPSFYKRNESSVYCRRQRDLAKRLIMYGVNLSDTADFSRGYVYGVVGGYENDPLRRGSVPTGILGMDRSPSHIN